MDALYVSPGDAIDYTPGSALDAGEIVIVGELAGFTKTPIAAGTVGALHLRGIVEWPKAAGGGGTFAAGDFVYWDGSTTTTSSGDDLIGRAVAAAANGASSVRVLFG
mgnify:CR=1 FL=1